MTLRNHFPKNHRGYLGPLMARTGIISCEQLRDQLTTLLLLYSVLVPRTRTYVRTHVQYSTRTLTEEEIRLESESGVWSLEGYVIYYYSSVRVPCSYTTVVALARVHNLRLHT